MNGFTKIEYLLDEVKFEFKWKFLSKIFRREDPMKLKIKVYITIYYISIFWGKI